MDTNTKNRSFKAPSGSGALAPANTLLLTRSDIERLLTQDECIAAFEDAAAATAVYRRALAQQQGVHFSFNL